MSRFDVPLSVVLDGTGAGTVSASVPWGQDWTVTTVTTSTDQAATTMPYPVCKVYRGAAVDANLLAATYSGQLDSARANERFLPGGRPQRAAGSPSTCSCRRASGRPPARPGRSAPAAP